MKRFFTFVIALLLGMQSFSQTNETKYNEPVPGQWTKKKANEWYAKLPWIVGANYLPATAINQIDM